MRDLVIKPLTRADVWQVAALHAEAFPESTLTALGIDVLERYYAWLLDGVHDAQITGAWHGQELAGFCAAGVFRGAMSGFLRANRPFLFYRVLRRPALLLHATFRERLRSGLAITLRFSRRISTLAARSRASVHTNGSPNFGVLSIATSHQVRGHGVGRALMLDAEARARTQGFKRMTLTVHPENTRAVRFYRELGWMQTLNEGVWSGAMHRVLDGGS